MAVCCLVVNSGIYPGVAIGDSQETVFLDIDRWHLGMVMDWEGLVNWVQRREKCRVFHLDLHCPLGLGQRQYSNWSATELGLNEPGELDLEECRKI